MNRKLAVELQELGKSQQHSLHLPAPLGRCSVMTLFSTVTAADRQSWDHSYLRGSHQECGRAGVAGLFVAKKMASGNRLVHFLLEFLDSGSIDSNSAEHGYSFH